MSLKAKLLENTDSPLTQRLQIYMHIYTERDR